MCLEMVSMRRCCGLVMSAAGKANSASGAGGWLLLVPRRDGSFWCRRHRKPLCLLGRPSGSLYFPVQRPSVLFCLLAGSGLATEEVQSLV